MRKNLLWTLAATVLLSFAGCRSGSENGTNGGNEASGKPEEKKSLDTSFIPEDCFFTMVIHPKRIADSPLAKELSEDVTEEVLGGMRRGAGLDPRKMEEVVVLGLPREPTDGRRYGPPFDGGFIIRFSEPVANKKLLRKMFGYLDFADEQATHAGKEYYREWSPRDNGDAPDSAYSGSQKDPSKSIEEPQPHFDEEEPRGSDEPADFAVDEEPEPRDPNEPADFGVHFADDRTMVFSDNEAILKKMLSADEVKSDLVERLGQLDADNDLIAVVTVEGSGEVFDKLAEELSRELPPGMRGLLGAAELGSAATLTADLRADPMAELIVSANDAKSAAKLKKVVESTIIIGESLFADESDDFVRHSPPGVGRPLVELVEQTFDAVTVTEDGEKVTATLKRPEALARLPVIITIAAEHELEQRRRWDSDAIDGLCQRARRDFVEKRFAQLESRVWEDEFLLCSSDDETGQPVIAPFDTAVQVWQDRVEAFDEIAPHPASTQFEIQAPVAVVRLPMASCRKGELASPVEYLAIAARQNGSWRIAAAMRGNWKLTEADRFNPRNEDHRALQAFYDRNQVIIDEDADGLRDVNHPLLRTIYPGSETDRQEDAFIGDLEGVVSYFQDLWQRSDFQKSHNKIVFAKVIGPLALTLSESSQIVDDGPEEKWKCLQFLCRDGDQWRFCLWMPGDWEKIFMVE